MTSARCLGGQGFLPAGLNFLKPGTAITFREGKGWTCCTKEALFLCSFFVTLDKTLKPP